MSSLMLEQPALQRVPAVCPPSRRPLRVCYLIDELATAGTETQLLALLRGLDRRKVQPYLCLLRGDNAVSQSLEPTDIPVMRLGIGSLSSPRSLGPALRFIRFLRRERIDALQAYFYDSSYFGVPLAWLAGVPYRVRTRNNSGHSTTPLQRILGRCINRFTTCTLTNCHAARDSLLNDERPKPAKVNVLENGVDLDRFEQVPAYRGPTNQILRIGAVANLRPVKGLDVLVEAVRVLAANHTDLSVEIVGEGSEREALQRQIDAAGLGERIVLTGASDNVVGFLACLEVAVLASHSEGLPNAVLEYMAAGRPIVATRVGAVPELIEHEVHGLLVPPNDPNALAAAIARFLSDKRLATTCAAAARQRVSEQYSRAAMLRRFEDFYDCLPRH